MKKLAYLFMAMPALLASCSSEDYITNEAVEVNLSAALPQPLQTRAAGTTLNVDKVVCAVFEATSNSATDYTELEALRETIDIADGQNIVYSPRLVKGRTYKVVFWAMNGDSYNVSDMTNISPKIAEGDSFTGDPAKYECFSNCTEFTVSGSLSQSISLTRPMARINIGVSNEDMQAVINHGYSPTKVEVSFSVPQSYNALGKSCGIAQSQTMTLPVATEGTLTIGDTDYKAMASYMVFTDGSNINLTYKVFGTKNGSEEEIVSNTIQNVPVGVNKNTNVVGDLMTGAVNYTVTMDNAYDGDLAPTTNE